jgi:hypothetical protein
MTEDELLAEVETLLRSFCARHRDEFEQAWRDAPVLEEVAAA